MSRTATLRSTKTYSHNHGPLNSNVAKRLTALRVIRGIPQDELARTLKINVQALRRFERGQSKIPVDVIGDAATVLRVDPSWFLACDDIV